MSTNEYEPDFENEEEIIEEDIQIQEDDEKADQGELDLFSE